MSQLVVNGMSVDGDTTAIAYLFFAINAVVESGDSKIVTFDGDRGRTAILVNSATQVQLTTDDRDNAIFKTLAPNTVDILKNYGLLDANGRAVTDELKKLDDAAEAS